MTRQKSQTINFETVTPEAEPAEVPAGKLVQGFEWAKLPGVDERLEEMLWNAGVTDPKDLNQKPQAVIGALMAYHGLGLVDLREKIKEFINE